MDGVVPPAETVEKLKGLDFVILEGTMDELDETWKNFSLGQAVDFWKSTGVARCFLTHLSCHSWRKERLRAGLSFEARSQYEAGIEGLRFAHDGLRVPL